MNQLNDMLTWLSNQDSRLIISLAVLLLVFLIRRILRRIITKRVENIRERNAWLQSANALTFGSALILLVVQWISWFQHILTVLTLIAAALTIISKEFLLNPIAYAVIIWRGLFNVGDRIQISGTSGDVVRIGAFYITLAEIGNWISGDEFTGRMVKVPNSDVLTKPIFNYTRGSELIWDEVRVELDITSNRDQARNMALAIAEKNALEPEDHQPRGLINNTDDYIFENSQPKIFTDLVDNKLYLNLTYLSPFNRRRELRQAIIDQLLQSLEENSEVNLAGKKPDSN
jgi:small-conductance mechanosensitive channel